MEEEDCTQHGEKSRDDDSGKGGPVSKAGEVECKADKEQSEEERGKKAEKGQFEVGEFGMGFFQGFVFVHGLFLYFFRKER